jgi:7-cyano-7-deazaguanine reductase
MTQAHDELRALASKHLGKAGDGTIVAAYVTPTQHDNTLLVPLPRSLNRAKSNINSNKFVGYEVWHAYEMSFIGKTGMPVTGVLKVKYSATSESMIESKSFKLYLNSFDLEKFQSKEEVEEVVKKDLSEALIDDVEVTLHIAHTAEFVQTPFDDFFDNVDDYEYELSEYNENANLLEAAEEKYFVAGLSFHTANLRSNCEITNQKDTGNCYIFIKGNSLPTKESLTKYIISFRDSQHFHENVTEIIYTTLLEKFKPEELFVADIYNRRGGLDIHSVRASSQALIDILAENYEDTKILFEKTSQQ